MFQGLIRIVVLSAILSLPLLGEFMIPFGGFYVVGLPNELRIGLEEILISLVLQLHVLMLSFVLG